MLSEYDVSRLCLHRPHHPATARRQTMQPPLIPRLPPPWLSLAVSFLGAPPPAFPPTAALSSLLPTYASTSSLRPFGMGPQLSPFALRCASVDPLWACRAPCTQTISALSIHQRPPFFNVCFVAALIAEGERQSQCRLTVAPLEVAARQRQPRRQGHSCARSNAERQVFIIYV